MNGLEPAVTGGRTPAVARDQLMRGQRAASVIGNNKIQADENLRAENVPLRAESMIAAIPPFSGHGMRSNKESLVSKQNKVVNNLEITLGRLIFVLSNGQRSHGVTVRRREKTCAMLTSCGVWMRATRVGTGRRRICVRMFHEAYARVQALASLSRG